MDENEFWIAVWKIVAAAVCVFILSISGCLGYANKRIADAADPLLVGCAMGTSHMACAIAQRK